MPTAGQPWGPATGPTAPTSPSGPTGSFPPSPTGPTGPAGAAAPAADPFGAPPFAVISCPVIVLVYALTCSPSLFGLHLTPLCSVA